MAERKTASVTMEAPLIHIPSPYFNRGEWNGGMNFGRLEHDALHHVSAAMQAAQAGDWDKQLALRHIAVARSVLDRIEGLVNMLPDNA